MTEEKWKMVQDSLKMQAWRPSRAVPGVPMVPSVELSPLWGSSGGPDGPKCGTVAAFGVLIVQSVELSPL